MNMNASEASISFFQDSLRGKEYKLESWHGYEEFNHVYEHVVTVRCADGQLRLNSFFLKPAELEIKCHITKDAIVSRIIKGIIREVTIEADEANQFLYTFYIVPQLWNLSQKVRSRIFQEKSSRQIVQEVIQEYGIPLKMKLKQEPRIREYCVQYQESDLDFITRLAEDDGFYFFFKQDEDKVIFIDDPITIESCLPLSLFKWDPGQGFVQQQPESIQKFQDKQQPRWKQVLVKEYNYLTPERELLKQAQAGAGAGSSYQYFTGHMTSSEGEAVAKVRLQEHRAGIDVATMESSVRSVAVGYKFFLQDFPAGLYNSNYQIIRVLHQYKDNHYTNSFTCLPATTPYRPPRITHKPTISGLQTAIVVGLHGFQPQNNSADDLYVDEFGRIKVLFHWDLDQSRNEKSSCWIRLLREYAGTNYGVFFLPRVGNEVIVSFLEGDPDRPVVIGSVHHANNIPPILEPDKKTQNTLLMPSKNELRFEDKEGQEEIYMHAQKNHTRVVRNNECISIGNNLTTTVSGSEQRTVKGTRTTKVGTPPDPSIAPISCPVSGTTESVTIVIGDYEIKVDQGAMNVEAKDKIVLKVGGSTITMMPDVIDIKSPLIKLNC